LTLVNIREKYTNQKASKSKNVIKLHPLKGGTVAHTGIKTFITEDRFKVESLHPSPSSFLVPFFE
jgi:hypothetical protein